VAKKNPAAVALGRLRASKGPSMQEIGAAGGQARAEALTGARRKEIAKKAAKARWTKKTA